MTAFTAISLSANSLPKALVNPIAPAFPELYALALALPVSLMDYHGLTLLAILLGVFALAIEIKRGFYFKDIKIQPLYLYLLLIFIGSLSLIWSYNFDVSLERFVNNFNLINLIINESEL